MPKKYFVVFEGPTGVGKTTLALIFKPILNAEFVMELGKNNPFLMMFLTSPKQYALPMQLLYLIDRYKQHSVEIPRILENKSVISDSMFARDWIFSKLGLDSDQLMLYEPIYRELAESICLPDLIVYLRADAVILHERLKKRGEDIDIWSKSFLQKLNHIYDDFFGDFNKCPIITIDTDNLDFINTSEHITLLQNQIQTILLNNTHNK